MKNLLLICSLLSVMSCSKKSTTVQTPQLPPATQTGANTFGCKINGNLYIVTGRATNANPKGLDCAPSSTQNHLYISANNVFSLNTVWAGTTGTFEMAGDYPYHGYYWDLSNGTAITGSNEYKTDSVHNGAVTVTFFNGAIISGTFWFDGINDSGTVVHITDGRFDISLN